MQTERTSYHLLMDKAEWLEWKTEAAIRGLTMRRFILAAVRYFVAHRLGLGEGK